MVALWDHRVRPHHHGWVLGSLPNGLDMFVYPEKMVPRIGNGDL